jgi:hypothetical protein
MLSICIFEDVSYHNEIKEKDEYLNEFVLLFLFILANLSEYLDTIHLGEFFLWK